MNREQRIDALLDKQAITDLLYAYCHASDRRDYTRLRSLYHEDAFDDHGVFFQGLAMEFIDRLPEIQAPMQILHHNLTTMNIALEGDYAEGEIYVLAFHQMRAEEGAIDVLIGGRYLDKYEKRDGVWKFTFKSALADWVHVNDPTRVALDHPFVSASPRGRTDIEDPVFQTFRLIKFGEPHKHVADLTS